MRPAWPQLERPGSARRVWSASKARFVGNILGPCFERICRGWALWYADPETFGGLPARVGHGVVHDTENRKGYEVDVAVLGIPDGGKPPLLAIGEATWNEEIGPGHLERLRQIRRLVQQHGRYETSNVRLLLFSGVGFDDTARTAAAEDDDIVLVDLGALSGR